MAESGWSEVFEDWRPGRLIDRCCLKKVVCAAGLTSYSGDAEREFAAIRRWLETESGFDAGDFLEATYSGWVVDGAWLPRRYCLEDAQASIDTSSEALARELEWYRARLPATRFHLLGYSLGGVIAFEAAARLISRNAGGWRGRLAAVATLSSPLLGVAFGILANLARQLAARPDFYGRAGLELVERGRDPETLGRLESLAALLRANGVRLLTVVDSNDAVVIPRDAILPSARARGEVVAVDARLPRDADEVARRFGHGPVLADPSCLSAVGRLVGPQECLGAHRRRTESDAVEAELAALKARLRGPKRR